MLVFMFPGQGSQQKGMGEDLFNDFFTLTDRASSLLGYCIKTLCVSDPERQLSQTQYTQPALYVVNALSYLKRFEATSEKPDYVIGHSLGEYAALYVAGGVDFETGLRLVQKRGELMGQARSGGMAAVLGLSRDQVAGLLESQAFSQIDIANDNSPTQIVIAGPPEDLKLVAAAVQSINGKYIPLNVSAAFHSRYMNAAQKEFEEYLSGLTFRPLTLPLITTVKAELCTNSEVSSNLRDQITSPVRWTESVRFALDIDRSAWFEELGPGTTLTKLVNEIREQA